MSKPAETLVVVNSANRNISVYPEPNDFVLDLKQRFEVQLISLGCLQLPYSQFLVEHDWDSFLFDVGLSFPLQVARTLQFRRTLEGGGQKLVCLPAPYTQLVYVGRTSANLALWSVDPRVGPVVSHGLAQASLGIIPVKVIFDPTKDALQVCAIPSPSEILTSRVPSEIQPGYTAVLSCTSAGPRTFCSAEHLCRALNAFFGDASIQLPLRFNYNAAEMTLALQPQALTGESFFLLVSESNLLSTLCFPCLRDTIPLQPMLSTRFPAAIERRMPIGNYDYPSLRQQVEMLLNPMGQFSTIPNSKIYINFFGEKATPPFTEALIAGTVLYDPKAIALWVSEQLDAAKLLDAIRVDFQDDTFVIFSKTPFRIFWGDSRLGAQLGFDSDLRLDVFHRGSPRFYCQTPSRVQLAQIYGGESCQHMKTLVFQASGRLQGFKSDSASVQASGYNGVEVPVGSLPAEYLVALRRSPKNGFAWTVSSLTQAGIMPAAPAPLPKWTMLLSSLVPEDLSSLVAAKEPILPVPVFTGAVNLYFPTPPGSMQPRMAEILGFEPGAALWPLSAALDAYGPSAAMKAPYHVTLEGPFYVLVELGLEHMSATITHRTGNDVKSRYFAAVAMFSNFKLERYYKAEQATTGINVVNSFHVRITNPWGSIYQFHGKNWSAALNFVHVQKAIRTECP